MPPGGTSISSGPAVSSAGPADTGDSNNWNSFGAVNYSQPGTNWVLVAGVAAAALVAIYALR
jgi:hypothetical protein